MRKPVVRVHVNQHIIRANKTKGESNPPLTIRRGSKREYAHEVRLVGECRIVYSPDKPLDCGARVWVECDEAVAVGGSA